MRMFPIAVTFNRPIVDKDFRRCVLTELSAVNDAPEELPPPSRGVHCRNKQNQSEPEKACIEWPSAGNYSIKSQEQVMKGFNANIEQETMETSNFRRAYTPRNIVNLC